RQRRGGGAADAADGACAEPRPAALRLRAVEDQPGDGQGRGRLPALRAVRRTLPDRRMGHAEVPAAGNACRRRPRRTAREGGRMTPAHAPLRATNDSVVKFANVNGSGSASANELFAKAIL